MLCAIFSFCTKNHTPIIYIGVLLPTPIKVPSSVHIFYSDEIYTPIIFIGRK